MRLNATNSFAMVSRQLPTVTLGLAMLLSAGCSSRSMSVLLPAFQASDAEQIPVILVPGILGSKLRERRGGKILWGLGSNAIRPWDGGYNIAFPIHLGHGADLGTESFDVMDEVSFLGIRRTAYRLVEELFTSHGYRSGELRSPRAGDTFFTFHYDWRRLNTIAAARLARQLEALRQVRGEDRLKVHLICQSNGAYICRHFLKYGGASIDDAETKRAAQPPNIEVDKVILVGTANGGSFRTLRELNRGRVFVGLIGRVITPETIFTFRSLFQDLPAFTDEYLLDEHGKSLEADLYDVATWERFGWSIFDPVVANRLEKRDRSDLFGDLEARRRYLRERLNEARRLQTLLRRDAEGFGQPRYYMVQNLYEPTSRRAVVVRNRRGGWETLFTDDPQLAKLPYVHAVASAPGDEHATRESQMWLSPQERAAIVDEFQIQGNHFRIILDPGTRRRLLEMLRDDAAPSGSSTHSEGH